MRRSVRKDGFSVQAISGTRAVMLAMNARREATGGFLGFGVGIRDQANGSIRWLNGFKCFRDIVPARHRAQRFKTSEHPIQDFKWGHYWAEPGKEYRYVVRPLFRPGDGNLGALREGEDLDITIRTENETGGTHSVLFNRGAIVSQAYAEQFANDENLSEDELKAQLEDANSERTKWLSRGLLEGALAFIDQANSSRFSLHCGFYELTYKPVPDHLAAAAARGAKVEVSYEAGHVKVTTGERV